MAVLIPAEALTRTVTPADGRAFTLAELHTLVGGYIEALRLPEGRVMFLNEHGKLHHLPRNDYATTMGWAAGSLSPFDHIVGDVVVCTLVEAGEDADADADADDADDDDDDTEEA